MTISFRYQTRCAHPVISSPQFPHVQATRMGKLIFAPILRVLMYLFHDPMSHVLAPHSRHQHSHSSRITANRQFFHPIDIGTSYTPDQRPRHRRPTRKVHSPDTAALFLQESCSCVFFGRDMVRTGEGFRPNKTADIHNAPL